ncbi:Holliday junction resolvase RusA-like endonuclease [Novosphingobium chloroacetimidivorans]|uniref:Holliday junction resolvase RusA-like endonuclease n=1 Tax=Novosphingobium chloroacetimidivorans TaxID=1428314 RepID=A0A7W7K666_9SPHN|nr:RusA family crossover junction endodeoxyribonuclease [Novosphingobium chloroacetimidivorans]MBB4856994.1 Holliday junction resolvase RusA-like endonuclease [Novosphingobium chloroacetimidivorans]
MTSIHITVPGTPQGKGRARFGNGRTYTPAKTVAYEGLIALAAEQAMGACEKLEGPVFLTITATFDIPKSRAKKVAKTMVNGIAWHTAKPDGDNILKAVGDGLNGIVWKDDSQVAFSKCMKMYGEKPGLDILVEVLP